MGWIVTVLLPIAFLFFGILKFDQTLAAILFLSGAWTFLFGLLMENKDERLYYSGSGVIVALLSTNLFIALRYTIGLVLVAFVVLALISALSRKGPATKGAGISPG